MIQLQMFQFYAKLKNIRKFVLKWEKKKIESNQTDLKQVDVRNYYFFQNNLLRVSNDDESLSLNNFDGIKKYQVDKD